MSKFNVRKILVCGIILLFVGASIIPSMGGTIVEKQISKENKASLMRFNPRGNILYVGGSGPNNYTRIQDAIDNASDGDTVFVYNGTYYESIVVDISVDLIGEDRNTTTIYGDGNSEATVEIIADWVNISGFTSQHSEIGIRVFSHNIIITGNTVTNNAYGIDLDESCSDVIVEGNAIVNNNYILSGGGGICVYGSDISIKGNLIGGHVPPGMLFTVGEGISLHTMSPEICNINISWNTITDNLWGVFAWIYTTSNVTFYMNDITNNTYGMEIMVKEQPNSTTCNVGDGKSIIIKQNNFIKNKRNVFRSFRGFNIKMFWENNYWGRFRLIPKLVVVFRMITEDFGIPSRLEFDWRPAREPYDIPKVAI